MITATTVTTVKVNDADDGGAGDVDEHEGSAEGNCSDCADSFANLNAK